MGIPLEPYADLITTYTEQQHRCSIPRSKYIIIALMATVSTHPSSKAFYLPPLLASLHLREEHPNKPPKQTNKWKASQIIKIYKYIYKGTVIVRFMWVSSREFHPFVLGPCILPGGVTSPATNLLYRCTLQCCLIDYHSRRLWKERVNMNKGKLQKQHKKLRWAQAEESASVTGTFVSGCEWFRLDFVNN